MIVGNSYKIIAEKIIKKKGKVIKVTFAEEFEYYWISITDFGEEEGYIKKIYIDYYEADDAYCFIVETLEMILNE